MTSYVGNTGVWREVLTETTDTAHHRWSVGCKGLAMKFLLGGTDSWAPNTTYPQN